MGIDCCFTNNKKDFYIFFDAFAKQKKLNPTSHKFLDKIGDNLFISVAKHAETIYATHFYVVDFDASHALLYRSASRRVFDKSIMANTIGKANKLLHYEDMLHFKSLGIKTYGFGGYWTDKETDQLQGINKFKSSFGGEVAYNLYYQTIPYYLGQLLKKLITRL